MNYILAIVLSLAIGLPSSTWAQHGEAKEEHGGGKKEGRAKPTGPFKGKYEVIGTAEEAQALQGAKQVEMAEFFNYSCGHCYRFLETSKQLRAKYKDKLLHKKYPIYWGDQTSYPAMAFYIADEEGVEEKFTQELFDTNFKLNINIFKPKVIQILAKDFGIENKMTTGMQSEKIKNKVANSLEMAKKYNANETPTIILNKVLKVTPGISGGSVDAMTENLDIIIQDILKPKAQ